MSQHTNTRDPAGALEWAGTILVLALIGTWALLRFLFRHPKVALALVAVVTTLVALDRWGALALIGLVVAAGVVVWWRLRGASVDGGVVGWRVRLSWRGWRVYGRSWANTMDMAGLHVRLRHEGVWYVPWLVRVRSNEWMDRLTVRLLRGQHPDDFQDRADTLAHAFGALACRARVAGPGLVHLDLTRRDALADVVPALPIPDEPDLKSLPIGRREDGRTWRVRLLGAHTLIAGVTGAGKGSVLQSLLRPLGPYLRSGLVRLYGIDPKGGMELGAAGAKRLYRRLVTSAPAEWAELLEALVADMQARAARLAGVTRLHTPTVDDPLVVLVVDELASLTAYKPKTREARELFARIEAALNLLLSQGRAVGFIVIAALQDPRKEVIPSRDLFPVRIALRLIEEEATEMVLGPGARDRGADCSRIPADMPGTAWVWCDGEPEPTRVRAGYPTDDDIAHLVEHYQPTPDPATATAPSGVRLGGLVVDLPAARS